MIATSFRLRPSKKLRLSAQDLRTSAGSHSVADNLTRALTDALTPIVLATISLVTSRHELLARLRLTTPDGVPLLAETNKMIAAYLTAERGLGRIELDTDVDAVAVILVGSAHLMAAGRPAAALDPGDLRLLLTIVIPCVIQQLPVRAVQARHD